MDGLLPEMGIRRCAESHRDVRELDVRAPRTQIVTGEGFRSGAGLPFPVTKAGAGDYKTAGSSRAECGATGRPLVADDTIRHA